MENKKDRWDKLSVVLQPVGGLLTALAILLIGQCANETIQDRQRIETNARLYTELMSKREEAESALRRDMFTSIIQTFSNPTSASLEEKVLKMELLAYNFHESIILEPLFVHLRKQIRDQTNGSNKDEYNGYIRRLEKIAREIILKQMIVLEAAGEEFDETIELSKLENTQGGKLLDVTTQELELENIKREFKIQALKFDPETKEVTVKLYIRTLEIEGAVVNEESTVHHKFGIGLLDFPMIDNIRLSNNQRCAIVMKYYDYDEEVKAAEITLVYFPGSYASLKEKPYYDDVLRSLRESNVSFDENGR